MKKTFILTVVFLSIFSHVKADFTRKMVCRWTFNSAEENKALTDDISGVKLTKAGIGGDQTLSFHDGVAHLGTGMLLVASSINSSNEKFTSLKNKITIWARLKFTSKPHGFFIGLLNADKPADWPQQVFTAHISNKGKLWLYGTNSEGKHFGSGTTWRQTKKPTFIDFAITFDREKKSFSVVINGKINKISKSKSADKFGAFKCFSIGRLKRHIGMKLIVDEIRIYNSVVPSEWLGEIEPVK